MTLTFGDCDRCEDIGVDVGQGVGLDKYCTWVSQGLEAPKPGSKYTGDCWPHHVQKGLYQKQPLSISVHLDTTPAARPS